MPAKKEISLLPDEENLDSFSARAFRWLTTVGRYVIVFTELIVICAFLSRFWLDRTNSDLSEIIRQQQAILASTGSFETEYSQLQQRLNIIKNFYQNQPEYQSKLQTLTESTPLDITYTNLALTKNASSQTTADISFSAYQESSIVNFITNLIVNPQISSVNILTIEKKTKENIYHVSLSLVFGKNPNGSITQ
jgi:Tfp pilus assembly protein PilN